MKVNRIDHSRDSFQRTPTPRVPGLRDAFNSSAASMGVGAASPLSMASAAGMTAAMRSLPPAAPIAPRKDSALVFNPASLSGVSLLNGLLDSSFAAAIMKSAAEGDDANLRLLLSKQDTLPDFANAQGLSPLMAAAARGQGATLEILAAHPLVNLARADAEGWTALHFAAHLNQREAIAILLKHHAAFDMETVKGQIAFDLGDAETQQTFLQHAGFKRFLKTRNPAHPLLSPAAPPVHTEEAQIAETPPPVLTETFYDALKSIGIAMQKGAPLNVREELNAKLAQMDLPNLAKAHRAIAQTGVKYDWDNVFIQSAGTGNTAAMVFLQDEIYFDQRTLNRALWQAAATGQRDAAHHLMLWEADPLFSQRMANGASSSAIALAWQRRNVDVIEEMALWSDIKKTLPAVTHYLAEVREKMATGEARKKRDGLADDDLFMPLVSLSAMLKRREEMSGERTHTLKENFARVAKSGNITEILATYAEAQRPRFLRAKVDFDAMAGGNAMGWALFYGRVEFARKLAADGYKLADALSSLQEKAKQSKLPAARTFADENLSGAKHYPRIEDTGKRSTSPSAIRQLRTGLYID